MKAERRASYSARRYVADASTGTNSPAKLHGADDEARSFAYGEELFRLIESSHLISRITGRDEREKERELESVRVL